jgi:hypothetical protein
VQLRNKNDNIHHHPHDVSRPSFQPAQFRDGPPPDFFTLRVGANGEPVVLVACVNEPYGWLRALRRKE